MASAGDNRLAAARLMTVAAASRLSPATEGSQNSYTTSRDTTQTTHARCNLEPHNRDPLIRNTLRPYNLTCGVSRISKMTNVLGSYDIS